MRKKTPPTDPESESYLFVVSDDAEQPSPENVFYQASDPELAESLCRLCKREYGDEGTFIHKPSSSFSPDEQILLDEAINQIDVYDDPDPGVYDPPPSRQTMLRASYAHRVEGWAEMLRSKKARVPASQNTDDGPLTDDVLLQICRTSAEDEQVTTEWMADLRLVASLVAGSRTSKQIGLEHAVTMLAACIGQLPQYHPTHFPLGYSGPTIRSHHWMDRDALEQAAKQIVGMLWRDVGPGAVASDVARCVSEAIRLGFMEQQEYDAWRPGMRSGSGWRSAVTATPYGITKARACLETTLPRVPTNDHLPGEPATPDEPAARVGADATSKTTQNSGGENSDQGAVRQLAAALQELRLATGELLHRSETVDIYPEPEIKAYYEALRDAESHVGGISSHLAYGREDAGQFETRIRETLHKLSKAMEHVASDYHDRPGRYPLSKEDTTRGWKALQGLMPLEIVLASTTMKPDDLEMPAEDRRISGLATLLLLAQAYYKMLECVISIADWCTALDVELNQSYFWVTASLTNLLKNHEDLRDFPIKFEPLFRDLYPSTVRNLAWDDMVAPDAERFLSTVQRYVHEKGVYEPEEDSIAWTFVQLYRPSVEVAISRAENYHKRMRQFVQESLGAASAGGDTHASDEISATGQTDTSGEISAGSDTHHAGATGADPSSGGTGSQSSDERPKGPSADIGEPGENCRVLGAEKKPLTEEQRTAATGGWAPGAKERHEEGLRAWRLERKQAFLRSMQTRLELEQELQDALQAGDLWRVLAIQARSVANWAVELKGGLLELIDDDEDGCFRRRFSCGLPTLRPLFLLAPFIGSQEAFDLLELAHGHDKATAFKARLESLEKERIKFSDAVAELAKKWDAQHDFEAFDAVNGHRRWLRDRAFEFVRYVENLTGLLQAGTPATRTANHPTSSSHPDKPSRDAASFEWARQAELVRATNQVLGEGLLHKGVLSRACTAGHVETNGKSGQGSRVRVSSFLTWVSRQFRTGKDELDQVRNAVIGEITARNK